MAPPGAQGEGSGEDGSATFDVARTYARLMKFYGLSDARLDRMDYLRFFALVREMGIYQQEEADARRRAGGAAGEGDGGAQEIAPEAWGEMG